MDEDLLQALGRDLRADLDADAPSDVDPDDPWLAPFTDDERGAVLDGALARIDAGESLEPADAVEDAPAGEELASTASVAPSAGAEIIDLRARRIGIGAGVILAAAAALALVWFQGRGPGGDEQLVAMLPTYSTSELHGGLATQRGDAVDAEAQTIELSPSGPIDWILTPSEPVHEGLAVGLLAVPEAGGEPIYRPDVAAQISDSGAVRLRGPLDTFIELGPGRWQLTLVIAPTGSLPRDRDQALDDGGGWQRATIRATIRGAP